MRIPKRYLAKVGSKGGRVSGIAKGLAKQTPERRREIVAMSHQKRRENTAARKLLEQQEQVA